MKHGGLLEQERQLLGLLEALIHEGHELVLVQTVAVLSHRNHPVDARRSSMEKPLMEASHSLM